MTLSFLAFCVELDFIFFINNFLLVIQFESTYIVDLSKYFLIIGPPRCDQHDHLSNRSTSGQRLLIEIRYQFGTTPVTTYLISLVADRYRRCFALDGIVTTFPTRLPTRS